MFPERRCSRALPQTLAVFEVFGDEEEGRGDGKIGARAARAAKPPISSASGALARRDRTSGDDDEGTLFDGNRRGLAGKARITTMSIDQGGSRHSARLFAQPAHGQRTATVSAMLARRS
jgi:hypothetical protein